jgi:type I site-specific restriction endonuclease
MPELDKKSLTEQDIRTKFITPALAAGNKWDVMNQIREEVYFTKGRVIVRGQSSTRGEPKKADYILSYKPGVRLAVLEAKDNNHAPHRARLGVFFVGASRCLCVCVGSRLFSFLNRSQPIHRT